MINLINNTIYESNINISTINYLNNIILEGFNNSIISIFNKTKTESSLNETIINTIIRNNINGSLNNAINISTMPIIKNINISTIPIIKNINKVKNDFIFTSSIKSYLNINNKPKLNSTSGNYAILTDIFSQKLEEIEKSNITDKSIINDIINLESTKTMKNNYPNDSNTNIKININNNDLKEKTFIEKIFGMFKSFLKNKLMYFLFALLGVVFCFIVVILISCAIISCFKMFKRRDYMEQIDDIQKDSKYNTASLSSRSN